MIVQNNIRWFVNENELSASLMSFHARIHIHKKEDEIVFQTVITDNNMDKIIMTFPSMEEAYSFVQSVVSPCITTTELLDKIKEVYQDKKPKIKKHKVFNQTYQKKDNNQ